MQDTPSFIHRPFEERWELAQKRYKGTIRTFARNFVRQLPGMEIEDIEQELLVHLWRCVEQYDPDKGASFNTLFQGCALRKCISLVRTASTKSRTGIVCSLTEEAVAAAVDDAFNEVDTADTCIIQQELHYQVAKYGADALLAGKRIRGAERHYVEVA